MDETLERESRETDARARHAGSGHGDAKSAKSAMHAENSITTGEPLKYPPAMPAQ